MAELRAMVLAAGLGTRLRPLTHELPKPLVPILGIPLLAFTLELVARAGATRAAVNLHHLPEVLRRALERGELRAPLPLDLYEEPTLLGTGGGLRNARATLDPADVVLLINGDTLIDADLGALVRAHLDSGAAATLLVRDNPDPLTYPPVETDAAMAVRRIAGRPERAAEPDAQPWLFAGVHVLARRVLELLPEGVSDVNRALHPELLARGERIGAVRHHGLWSDVGTPFRLLAANRRALANPPERLLALARTGGAVLADGVLWGGEVSGREGARVARAVVGRGAALGTGAVIEDSVLLAGVRIGPGAVIRDAVLGPGVEIPAGARIERELVTTAGRAAVTLEAET